MEFYELDHILIHAFFPRNNSTQLKENNLFYSNSNEMKPLSFKLLNIR
jgi:hypothetical protein